MVILMNSAMMPAPGVYITDEISSERFCFLLRLAHERGTLQSFIGYPATAEHIEAISGVKVAVTRAPATVKNGDVLLICRLRYRLSDTKLKSDKSFRPGPDDYQYLVSLYGCLKDTM